MMIARHALPCPVLPCPFPLHLSPVCPPLWLHPSFLQARATVSRRGRHHREIHADQSVRGPLCLSFKSSPLSRSLTS